MTSGDAAVRRLAAILETTIGFRASPGRLEWLAAAAGRTGYGAEELLDELGGLPTESTALDRLIDEVTVDESSFFRHRPELDAIDWRAAAASARSAGRGEVRVWSAACAKGEEAYTLAMLAAEALPTAPLSVLGTDISPSSINDARAGRYTERAVRRVPPEILERWFRREGHEFVVVDELRAGTTFARHNIATGASLPAGEAAFDVVVCRNALIYLSDRALAHAAEALDRAVAPGGVLVLGAADRLCLPPFRSRAAPRGVARRSPRKPRGRTKRRDPARPAPAASRGDDLDEALSAALATAARDPRDVEAHFLAGLLQLASDDAASAIVSLRRALYVDPSFAIAAFQLGRAHDAVGDDAAARRAYRQALATLDPDDSRADSFLGGLVVADIAVACRARLARTPPGMRRPPSR